MVKKSSIIILLTLIFWSCATLPPLPPPPLLHIENLPPSIEGVLSLEERILTEDAWDLLRKGKGDKAEKIISRLGTKSPVYNIGLGYANYLLNRLKIAEEFFKKALETYPDEAVIHTGLAQIFQKTGREDQAFSEFREILKLEPEHPWAKNQYNSLKTRKTEEVLTEAAAALAAGDKEKSKETYLKALYFSPKSTQAHLALAEIYRKENEFQNALIHLKAATSNEPENLEISKNYAETLYQAQQYTRSLEIYEKLSKFDPENTEFRDRIKSLHNKLGIFELPSQYESIASSEAITHEETAALLGVKLKGIMEEVTSKPPIIIDIATSWASKFILQMTFLGILDIYPNHTFQPKKIVIRAEMADILLRLIRYLEKKEYKFIHQIPPDRIQISDISKQNYYYQPIIQSISYGIMDLYPDRTFKPDIPVSGQEFIRVLDIILALIK